MGVIQNAAAQSNVAFKALIVTDLHTMKAGTSDPVSGAGDFCQTRMADLLVKVQRQGPYDYLINLGDTIHGAAASGTYLEQLVPYQTFDTGIVALYPSIKRIVIPGNHDYISGTNTLAQFLAACPGATTADGNEALGGDFVLYWVDSQGKNGAGGAYALSTAQQNGLTSFLSANPTKKVILAMHVPFALTPEIDRYYKYGSHVNPATNTTTPSANDMMVDADYFWTLIAAYPNLAQVWCGHWHLTSPGRDGDTSVSRPQVIFPAVSGRNNIPPPNNPWYGMKAGYAVATGFLNGSIDIQFYHLT
jgi:hypothetical protein